MNLLKKYLILFCSLLIFTGCKSSKNTKEIINLCKSYEQICKDIEIFIDDDFQINRNNASYLLAETKHFKNLIVQYKETIESNLYTRLASDREITQSLLTSTNTLILILDTAVRYPDRIDDEENKFFSSTFNKLHCDMIALEYDRIITSEEVISDYIKYFIIFIIFFMSLCLVFIIIFIFELKQRDIKLLETSNFIDYTIKGQEEERKHIAMELHDTVAQDIRYIISLTKKLEPSAVQKDILSKQESCLKQIRDICSSFVPQDIENKDLISSLNNVISNLKSQSNIEVKLTILDNINFKNMESERLLHFFRIIQECLNNAGKHSQATEVSILIKKEIIEDENFIHLIITDDGIGLDKQIVDSIKEENITVAKNHFGIKNIVQRVKLLNGTIDVISDKEFGTEINVIIPA